MCDPIGLVEETKDTYNMCGYGDESLKGINDSGYRGC